MLQNNMRDKKKLIKNKKSDKELEQIQRLQKITNIQEQIIQKVKFTKMTNLNINCEHIHNSQTCQQYQTNINYYQKFWRQYLINQMSHFKVQQLKEVVQEMESNANIIRDNLDQRQELLKPYKCTRKKRSKKSEIKQLESLICPFSECESEYMSVVSLQNHMKIKHGVPNKARLEQYAQNYWNYKRGISQVIPIKIKLPPGYLEEYGMLLGQQTMQKYLKLKQIHKWVQGIVDKNKLAKINRKSQNQKNQKIQNIQNYVQDQNINQGIKYQLKQDIKDELKQDIKDQPQQNIYDQQKDE